MGAGPEDELQTMLPETIVSGLPVTQGECSGRLFPNPQEGRSRNTYQIQRAAAAPLSSGRVLKANRRLWRGTVDDVDHRFEQTQTDPAAGGHPRQLLRSRRRYRLGSVQSSGRGLVGVDEADLRMPASPGDIGHREVDSSVDLLCGHARRQRRI